MERKRGERRKGQTRERNGRRGKKGKGKMAAGVGAQTWCHKGKTKDEIGGLGVCGATRWNKKTKTKT